MNDYEVCVTFTVKAHNPTHAQETVQDRLADVVKHDQVWADVLQAEGQGTVTDTCLIYAVRSVEDRIAGAAAEVATPAARPVEVDGFPYTTTAPEREIGADTVAGEVTRGLRHA